MASYRIKVIPDPAGNYIQGMQQGQKDALELLKALNALARGAGGAGGGRSRGGGSGGRSRSGGGGGGGRSRSGGGARPAAGFDINARLRGGPSSPARPPGYIPNDLRSRYDRPTDTVLDPPRAYSQLDALLQREAATAAVRRGVGQAVPNSPTQYFRHPSEAQFPSGGLGADATLQFAPNAPAILRGTTVEAQQPSPRSGIDITSMLSGLPRASPPPLSPQEVYGRAFDERAALGRSMLSPQTGLAPPAAEGLLSPQNITPPAGPSLLERLNQWLSPTPVQPPPQQDVQQYAPDTMDPLGGVYGPAPEPATDPVLDPTSVDQTALVPGAFDQTGADGFYDPVALAEQQAAQTVQQDVGEAALDSPQTYDPTELDAYIYQDAI